MKSTPPRNARWGGRAKVKHLRGIRTHGVELKEKLLPITLCSHTSLTAINHYFSNEFVQSSSPHITHEQTTKGHTKIRLQKLRFKSEKHKYEIYPPQTSKAKKGYL